jgi:hypothetical protein
MFFRLISSHNSQKSLAHYLESIYRDKEIAAKYYDGTGGYMLDDVIKMKMLKFLSILSELSFKLYWSEERTNNA